EGGFINVMCACALGLEDSASPASARQGITRRALIDEERDWFLSSKRIRPPQVRQLPTSYARIFEMRTAQFLGCNARRGSASDRGARAEVAITLQLARLAPAAARSVSLQRSCARRQRASGCSLCRTMDCRPRRSRMPCRVSTRWSWQLSTLPEPACRRSG